MLAERFSTDGPFTLKRIVPSSCSHSIVFRKTFLPRSEFSTESVEQTKPRFGYLQNLSTVRRKIFGWSKEG
jgi:hypothetical protein